MIDLIQKKFASYGAANQMEEEHAIKEILQDIALYGLWRADFDVQRFLRPSEQHSLSLWSEKFFVHKIEKLNSEPGRK